MLDKAEIERWQRLTDAMLYHAATDDPEAFAQVVGLLERATAKLPMVAYELRGPATLLDDHTYSGYSWADLARPLGLARQSVMERFSMDKVKGCRFLYHDDRIRKDGRCPACGQVSDR